MSASGRLGEPAPTPPEGETSFESLYRWVISDPRPLPPDVCADIEKLHSLGARGAGAEPASILADVPFKEADGETYRYEPVTALPEVAYREPTPEERQVLEAIRGASR